MNKIVEFLNANPVQYLATVGRDGKSKRRPFMFSDEIVLFRLPAEVHQHQAKTGEH